MIFFPANQEKKIQSNDPSNAQNPQQRTQMINNSSWVLCIYCKIVLFAEYVFCFTIFIVSIFSCSVCWFFGYFLIGMQSFFLKGFFWRGLSPAGVQGGDERCCKGRWGEGSIVMASGSKDWVSALGRHYLLQKGSLVSIPERIEKQQNKCLMFFAGPFNTRKQFDEESIRCACDKS